MPGAYYLHFNGSESYLTALLLQLLDELRSEVTQSLQGAPLGKPRLRRAISVYLDGIQRLRALRTLLFELQFEPAAHDVMSVRNRGYTALIQLELQALQWPHPMATARLAVAMTIEIVLAEHEAGGALPKLRHVMFDYLERRG